MKLYRVIVRRAFFGGPGTLIANIRTFRSKTKAINYAKKEAKALEDRNCFVKVEELILRELSIDNFLRAFDSEDIMDLVEQRNSILTLKEYEKKESKQNSSAPQTAS